MTLRPVLTLNRGSDLDFTVIWPDGPGDAAPPLNLTGFTVDAFDPHPALVGQLTLTITDAAAGQITGRIEWADDMPPGAIMAFSIRIAQGADATATPPITVRVL